MHPLTPKERLIRQVRGQEIDRVPSIGGWILGVRNMAELAGISVEQYLADPLGGTVRAHKNLQVDGMVQPVIPQSLDQVRTGSVQESDFTGTPPEAILELADSLPDSEKEILASFDAAAEEQYYRDYFETAFACWEGIEPIPNFWEIGGHFALYSQFGYVAFFMACALYPEAVGKIWWARNLHSRQCALILLKLYKEYNLVPLMFCGEDLCNNQGPMVSPTFLRKHYYPAIRLSLEPLVDAGIRLIHHCDGDVRPLVHDFIDLGFSGFQGFQYELGIDPVEFKKLRSRMGEEMLFFTGLSVSRTLPLGSPTDAKNEVEYFLDLTDGGKGMFLFTTNVTGVETPPENIRSAYLHLKNWAPGQARPTQWQQWPWGISHPGL